MGKSDRPTSVNEAFDFSTDYVHPWEIAKILHAVEEDEVYPGPHADIEFINDGISLDDMLPRFEVWKG